MDVRSYDPAIARWTSIDPVTHYSMSTYNAFDNNPVFWSDPSGADSACNTCGEAFDSQGRSRYDGNGMYIPPFERKAATEGNGGPPDKKSKLKVAIDPGHGIDGNNNPKIDPGAIGNNTKEKDLTLNISEAVNRYLISFDIGTLMIRKGDLKVTGNSLQYRVDKAKKGKSDIFVSIHINSAANKNASGFTVLYKNNGSNSVYNKRLAESIASTQTVMSLRGNGINVRNGLRVLNGFSSTGTAVLIEVGFISNSNDVNKMSNQADRIGKQIATGIYMHLNNGLPPNPPSISPSIIGIR
jgi:N-acetylmuramoyl-L-alanine amidase